MSDISGAGKLHSSKKIHGDCHERGLLRRLRLINGLKILPRVVSLTDEDFVQESKPRLGGERVGLTVEPEGE